MLHASVKAIGWMLGGPRVILEALIGVLETADDGVLRVTGTRVPIDTLVTAFLHVAAPEEVVLHYPTLQLADVYAV